MNLEKIASNKDYKIKNQDIEIVKRVLNFTGDGIWDFDTETKEFSLNNAFYHILGYDEGGTIKDLEELKKIVYPEDVRILREKIYKSNAKTENLNQEIRVKNKNGEWIWLYLKGLSIKKDGKENAFRVVGVVFDITDRKKINKELMAILESTDDGILVVNRQRKVVHYNKKFLEIWEIPKEKLKENDDIELVEYAKNKLKDPKEFIINLEKVIKEEKDRLDILEFKNGKIIERYYKPFTIDGVDRGCVWSFRDITDRKEVENLKVDNTKKEFELQKVREYDEIKTQFFSSIPHDLKTPVNILLSGVQLVQNMHKNTNCKKYKKVNKYINMMKQNCYRLIRLINNFVYITKADAQLLRMNLSNFNIVDLIENMVISMSGYAKSKGIKLVFDTDIEEKIMAVDPDMIERSILNIISNSLKFTETGGSIYVNIYSRENGIAISIKDTGIGIPKDKLKAVFEKFKQVNSTKSRENEGSGLGLSLVKAFVEAHGGKITVDSEIDKGSEFIIELPDNLKEEYMDEQDEKVSTRKINIERINVEFSDIYF